MSRTSRASNMSRTTSSNTSSAFAESTKLRIKEMNGDSCWACSSEDPQICHVVPRADRQTRLWMEKGLIDFPIDSLLNGIPLCPLCHDQFDYALDPGFAFMPTDLEYFIDFEIEDRERRKALISNGNLAMREVPTAEMYKSHQIAQGLIDPDDAGGLYRPIFIKKYLHGRRLPIDVTSYLSQPSKWHGAPLASIRRAIPILGTGRVCALDEVTRLQLEKLRNLYFLEEKETGLLSPAQRSTTEPRASQATVNAGQTRMATRHKRAPSNETASDQQHPSPKKRHVGGNYTYCPVLQREVLTSWSLGPQYSAEDAIKEFSPLLSRS